jgi:2-polyprenyl-6-methoxyphenol hydroxylase-like FAD-dependent oxidoreductase
MTPPGLPATTDILIVGAGPTGLALATHLQRRGLAPVVVDRLSHGENTSRAAVIHAHTLEVLERIGVSDRLTAAGLRLANFSIRDRDRILTRLSFAHLPSRYPYLLMLPQDQTEAILAAALGEAGGRIYRAHAVEGLRQTPDQVEVRMATPEGPRTVTARYVIGGDGMHSVVRGATGIGFTGAAYEDSFVLADVDLSWEHGRDEVMLFFSPAGLVVVAPLPARDRFRIVATMDQAPEHPEVTDIQQLLHTRGPSWGVGQVSRVHWSSRFRLHHRVADRYREGRLFLMGDAAHVHSPAGGQGMNTGLVDACVLGDLLSDVLSGRREPSWLDRYQALRRPAAKQVLMLAGRLTHMATMRATPARAIRNLVLGLFGHLPPFRNNLEMNLSGLSRRTAAQVQPV